MIFTRGNALSPQQNHLMGLDLKLASSSFLENKNIALTLFGLKSRTDELEREDSAFGFQFLYPNDLLHLSAGFQQIGDNFRAGIGFVPRRDIRESYLSLLLGPRPQRWGVRQISTGASFDYITDLDNLLLTRNLNFTPLVVRWDSGDQIETAIASRYEFLEENFDIHPDFTIPSGVYSFTSYQTAFQSARRRNLW